MKMLIYIKGNYRKAERITAFDIVSIWNKYVQFVSTLLRIYKIQSDFYLDIFNYRALPPAGAVSSPGPYRRRRQKAASALLPLFGLPPAQKGNVYTPGPRHRS